MIDVTVSASHIHRGSAAVAEMLDGATPCRESIEEWILSDGRRVVIVDVYGSIVITGIVPDEVLMIVDSGAYDGVIDIIRAGILGGCNG